jgi:prepilin-type N-terminal cleavage/methylation domain-containing protein
MITPLSIISAGMGQIFGPGATQRVVRAVADPEARGGGGFTLVELLVVLAIITVLSGIVLLGLPQMKASADVTKAGYDITGVLDRARTLAMARNTYTWVGFFEENPNSPGTAGTGQVVISVVSSTDGSQLPAASLVQVDKLMKVSSTHLDPNLVNPNLSTNTVVRPSVPSSTVYVGSSSFPNGTSFTYPVTPSGAPQYTFTNVIQFNPQGDAMRINDTPARWIEIDLTPARGTTVNNASKNVAAIDIDGIGGKVTLYRP